MGGIFSGAVKLAERVGCTTTERQSDIIKDVAFVGDIVGSGLALAGAVTLGLMHELEKEQQAPHLYIPVRT